MTQAPVRYPRHFDGPSPSVADDPDIWGTAPKTIRIQGDPLIESPTETLAPAFASFPPRFLLSHLRDGRIRVKEPIAVTWTLEDGTYIVEASDFNEYGEGDTIAQAIEDLQASIAELYFELDEHKDRLGADLQQVFESLTRKLRRIDATNSK